MTDTHQDIATDETDRLISSAKVQGTAVYDHDGERLGSIESVMIDKLGGHVDYAVLSFGGLFGIGADRFPLPWSLLAYDSRLQGYVVDVDRSMLDKAPRFTADEPRFDREYEDRLQGYYGITFPA